jgi:hypothetical protein
MGPQAIFKGVEQLLQEIIFIIWLLVIFFSRVIYVRIKTFLESCFHYLSFTLTFQNRGLYHIQGYD